MNKNKLHRILAIIPVLNEGKKIGKVISLIKEDAAEDIDKILVVDDGSWDNSREEAKACGAIVLSHEYNKGVGAAMKTGIQYALDNKYDIAVIMGGDNQDSPNEIKRLLYPILCENFDFVQGSRYMAGGRVINAPLFRLITTKIHSFLFRVMFSFPISDSTNGFRAFRMSIFNDADINIWQGWLDHYELEPYLLHKVIKRNFKVKEVPVTKYYPAKRVGYTKMRPILDWWSILRPLVFLKLKVKN